MLASELYYKLNSIDDNPITINGYSYFKGDITLPGNITMEVYFGKRQIEILKVSQYYYSKRAYLTSTYNKNAVEGEFSFRIDSVSNSSEEKFDEQGGVSVVKFNARVGKRPNNTIRYMGPMRTPTYSVRACLKNEKDEPFYVLTVGFHSKAKILDRLAPVTYIDVVGHISAPKKPGKSCAIILKNLILRKEVQAQ